MASRERNTRTRTVVALLLTVVCGGCLAACGGKQSAQSIVKETFDARQQINSGELSLSFSLSGSGLAAIAAPTSVRVSGPFQTVGPSQLPRFDLSIDLASGGHTLQTGAVSTPDAFFLKLAGVTFLTPPETRRSLQQSYARASSTAASRQSASTFAALGVDPAGWLEHPLQAGTAELAGTKTIHITAGLDLSRLLSDAARLSGAGRALGVGGGEVASLLSPRESRALVQSLRSARVDLYTGESDHLLRLLSVDATVVSSPAQRAVLHGLRSATLRLQLSFEKVNQPQTISAPKNPQPISRLLTALRQLGLASSAAGGTTEGGASGSAGASPAPTPTTTPYMACVERAGQNVASLQRCASLL